VAARTLLAAARRGALGWLPPWRHRSLSEPSLFAQCDFS